MFLKVLTKYVLHLGEILQTLGKHQDCAVVYIELANLLPSTHPAKALFFEQSAYEY